MLSPQKARIEEEELEPRARLIDGMCRALTERAYAEVTIAEVVRRARVSKRTFYEHFVDKQECFLAAYTDVSLALLRETSLGAESATPGEAQIAAAATAYFEGLEKRRQLLRGLMSAAHAAGGPALLLHHKFVQRFAAQMSVMVERGRKVHSEIPPLHGDLALAIVGGINELMLAHLWARPNDPLTALTPTVIEFARAVIFGPRSAKHASSAPKKRARSAAR